SDVDPQTRLREALAWCTAKTSKPVAATGDLNARTDQDSPPSSQLTRVSKDETSNSRGTWLLKTCEDSRLEILNGTEIETTSPGGFTSFQFAGKAVVDYVLFSRDFLRMVPAKSLQVIPVPKEWSDHAILALRVLLP
ncbi:hypothetical protein B0H11DRAFT_1645315, partial [Mycena galericulata]